MPNLNDGTTRALTVDPQPRRDLTMPPMVSSRTDSASVTIKDEKVKETTPTNYFSGLHFEA